MQAQPSIFKNDKQPEEREAALLLKPYRARSCTILRNPVLQLDDSTHTDSEMEVLLLDFLCHSLARHFQVIVSKCSLKLLEKTFTSSPFTYNRHKWKGHSSEPFQCSFHVGKPAHSPDLPQHVLEHHLLPQQPSPIPSLWPSMQGLSLRTEDIEKFHSFPSQCEQLAHI